MGKKRNKTVIVAEDEAVTQRVAKMVLEKMGYDTVPAENGQACLELLDHDMKPDLLLLDLEMPVMDGFMVLTALAEQKRLEDFPIMVLTAKTSQDAVLRALAMGAHDYVVKPFKVAELEQRISDLVFDVDEATLRGILSNLRIPDPRLFHGPGLLNWTRKGLNAYQAVHQGKSICVLLPEGVTPQFLAGVLLDDIVSVAHVFRKCTYGWRKVWPTYAVRNDNGK